MVSRSIILFASLLAVSSYAATWVISPTGTGAGTTNEPGSYTTAAAHTSWAAGIAPGDTVLLRGGLYDDGTNHLNFGFSGSAGNRVIWKSFPGEWARVTRRHRFGANGHHEFQDLEFYDPRMGELLADGRLHGMFDDATGPGNRFVNCYIHDTGNVWGGNSAGLGVHGCTILNVGMQAQDHVIYPAVDVFDNNIVGWCTGSPIENGQVGILIGSNIMFGVSETIPVKSREIGLSYSGSIIGNCLYGRQTGPAQIYCNAAGGENYLIAGNYSVGYDPISAVGTLAVLTVTNNVACQNQAGGYAIVTITGSSGTRVVNNNDYYATVGAGVFSYTNASKTFAEWKVATGFDANSTATDASEPSNFTRVYRNQHNPKRATVAIYNFTEADNVTVNLSGVLATGDTYQIINGQNYTNIVQTGVFGGSTLSFPMTNLVAAQIWYGTNTVTRTPTSPEFAAFIVIGAAPANLPAFELTGNAVITGNVSIQ